MKVRHYIPPRAMHNQDIFPDDEDPRKLREVLGGDGFAQYRWICHA